MVGRGASDRQHFLDCSVIVGAAAVESTMLQLNFEAFHIKDCGVVLAVNQSSHSDFTLDNSVMVKFSIVLFLDRTTSQLYRLHGSVQNGVSTK